MYLTQNEDSVIIYSCSYHSKPVCISFFCRIQHFEEWCWGPNNIGPHLLWTKKYLCVCFL